MSLLAMENKTLFFKVFKLYKIEYQYEEDFFSWPCVCLSIRTYKLSVKDHLIEKFEKLFCDASAEPLRGK